MPRKREDLTGQKFGRLTVVDYDYTDNNGETRWLCKCDCGNPEMISVRRQSLRRGTTTSCGCRMHELKDNLIGRRFGRLTVLGYIDRNWQSKSRWRCVCDCGVETEVEGGNLKSGKVRSCGCLSRDVTRERATIHGHSQTGESIYPVWKQMKARCYNPNNHAYKNYGGRGIFVCDEWRNNFQTFYDWALHHGYSEGLEIDRINNDDGYYPENCRWAKPIVQANNRRSCRHITYHGLTHTIAEWSRVLGVRYSSLQYRINNGDMSDFERHFDYED